MPLEAGVPYLVKWDKAADYDDNPTDYDITDPVFTGVTVSNVNTPVTSSDGNVEFRGNYSPVALPGNDASNLYLGTQNKLYWPSADKNIKSFRAYFHVALDGNQPARNIVVNLGEDSPTSVGEIQDSRFKIQDSGFKIQDSGDDVWYDLNGRKYTERPTKPGLYIHGGKKVVI